MQLNYLQPFPDIFNREKEATLKIKEYIGTGNHSHASVKHQQCLLLRNNCWIKNDSSIIQEY